MRSIASPTHVQSRCRVRRVVGAAALAAIVAGYVVAPGTAHAQDDTEVESVWQATAELAFTNASGNRDMTVITTGFALEHPQIEFFAMELEFRARYGSSDGETDIENYQGDMTIDLNPDNNWSPFLYTKAERDPTRDLDARFNTGAGATYKLRRDDRRGEASIAIALLHSYEALDIDSPAAAPNAAPSPHSALWSFQLDGRQDIREDVSVGHSTHYQPQHDAFSDYLLSLRTTFRVIVTSRIALSLSHEYNRDSTPARPEIEKDDHLVQAGILVEL